MPLDEARFPQLIRELYQTVARLEEMFPGRPFTPDGHMVGSLAECYAEYYYGLKLYECSNAGHDARGTDIDVEIKATQRSRVALRSGPQKLLVFKICANGSFEEVYNGNGERVWALVADKKMPSNGQHQVSLARLRELMKYVPEIERIVRVRAQESIQPAVLASPASPLRQGRA